MNCAQQVNFSVIELRKILLLLYFDEFDSKKSSTHSLDTRAPQNAFALNQGSGVTKKKKLEKHCSKTSNVQARRNKIRVDENRWQYNTHYRRDRWWLRRRGVVILLLFQHFVNNRPMTPCDSTRVTTARKRSCTHTLSRVKTQVRDTMTSCYRDFPSQRAIKTVVVLHVHICSAKTP